MDIYVSLHYNIRNTQFGNDGCKMDLVYEDALTDSLDFFEIKRDKTRISMNTLMDKATDFFTKNPQLKSHKISFNGLSLDDM